MSFFEIEKLSHRSSWKMAETHAHPHFELYYLVEGRREYYIDNILYDIPPHSFVLIPPNHFHRTEGGGFQRININFDAEYMSVLRLQTLEKCFRHKAVHIIDEDLPPFRHLLSAIEEENQRGETTEEMLKLKVAELILSINRYAEEKKAVINQSRITNPLIKNVIAVINLKPLDCTLASLSEDCSVSRSHLSREFKKVMGLNLSTYIQNRKIAEAIRLLKESAAPLDIIAEKCGFSSANYFGMVFKKIIGVSPQQYRKNHSLPGNIYDKRG